MAAARAHVKDPAHRTKVVLRRLPPAIAQQAVVEQVDARFGGRYDWSCFRPGNASQKNHRYSRLYLNFKGPEDVVEFAEVFNGHVFVNEKGAQFKALVEYAPSQQVPKSNTKKDARQGTIMKDPEYLEFLESISKPAEHLPSAEIQLERKEAERAAAGKEPPVVTPLMVYVRQQRAAKSMAQQAVVEQVDARFGGRYDWSCFRPGNASQKNHRYSRLYLNFKGPEDVVEFAEVFNGHVFVNEKGAQFKALVEYAPSQQVPKSNTKKDARQGTIMKDPEYLEFLESISKPAEHLPSAEIQLERKEAERAAAGKEPPVVTPLMVYVRQQRAAKSMAQQYVLRENAKEKPTYILVPKRDEHAQREKDATSGGISGSAHVAENKKEKIVLLKGRARVDSNTSDVTSQQQSGTPMKNAAQSSSRQDPRLEGSGRIIKTILSNKEGRHVVTSQHDQEGHIITAEKRPPRIPNPRSIVKDQVVENAEKNHLDDKHSHLHGSGPISEKTERHARNRDRPDRGVWAPRRYDKSASGGTHSSSSEFSPMQQHSGENFCQQADGHGERKIDPRGHGGIRGGPVENGHRHANRRGPPRGLKEMEISASTSDGKPSKRASANYGAHEILIKTDIASCGVLDFAA
uniref:UPF3 domain-containing protein n=1 Tax=Oryza barthii TaxID=65489 RepID=A0A0D3FW67_9ORYZ